MACEKVTPAIAIIRKDAAWTPPLSIATTIDKVAATLSAYQWEDKALEF
jgi:hypothetical protein